MKDRISQKTEMLSMAQRESACLKNRFVVLILFSLGLATMPPKLYGQTGAPMWTNAYVGPGNGGDFVTAAAVDGSGNVFVTGFSENQTSFTSRSYATVAYSSAGVALWTNLYNGSSNDFSSAKAIAVDSSGNVVVTGNSFNGVVGSNYFDTIKYSGAGVPLWTNRYPSQYSIAGPCAVAVDSSGNVFMASPVGIAAYSSGGALLWSNNEVSAFFVAVDSSGNVLVTASVASGSGNWDYITTKLSNDGVPLWTNRYDGGVNDNTKAIALDSAGNVFVTGHSFTSTNYYFATVGYSAAGAPLWTNRYNRPGGSDDRAIAMAVDRNGNVFVTGRSDKVFNSNLFSDYEYATVAYSSSGMQLWSNLYDNGYGGNVPFAIAVDAIGNVFVTGQSQYNGTGYATLAYSNAGVPLWTNRYDAVPGPSTATAIAVDGNGDVFVSGESADRPPYIRQHYTTIKYSSTAPKLNIQNLNSGFVLTWTVPGWNLQCAPTASSTFTNIPGATSPYTNTLGGQEGYFRLQSP